LYLGSIGTGKSNAIFQITEQVQESLTEDDILIIFDTKGDFLEKFQKPNSVIISNDMTACSGSKTDYWNIFNELTDDENLEENITEIATTLFYHQLTDNNQKFFPNAARDIFSAILYLLKTESYIEHLDNAYLRTWFDLNGIEEIKANLFSSEKTKAFMSYLGGADNDQSNQAIGVLSELQQLIRSIFIGNFKKSGELSIKSLIKQSQAKTIFIEYDLAVGNMLTPIYRLLLDLAIKEALSRKKNKGNVWFIIDEFKLIPHLQHIDDAINFGRSLGVKLILGCQNVEQLYQVYGEHKARSILSGLSTNIVFRLNDGASREYVQDTFGSNRKMEIFESNISSRGLSENIISAHVVEDWDITNLQLGEAIIGMPNLEPFIFKFDKYD